MQVTDVTFYDTLRCAVKYKFIDEDSLLLNVVFNKYPKYSLRLV